MCLAIPGKVLSLSQNDPLMRTGRVSFNGIVKEVNLAYVPEAKVNDYVIVHAGFAISLLDQGAAQASLEEFKRLEQMEMGDPAQDQR